jgi:hypothetical protein
MAKSSFGRLLNPAGPAPPVDRAQVRSFGPERGGPPGFPQPPDCQSRIPQKAATGPAEMISTPTRKNYCGWTSLGEERYRQDARAYGKLDDRDPKKMQNCLLPSERFPFDNSIVVAWPRMTPFKFKARYDLIVA